MGPGQLYQDLQNLIHDLSLVNQISNMISSLKGNYQVKFDNKKNYKYMYFFTSGTYRVPAVRFKMIDNM